MEGNYSFASRGGFSTRGERDSLLAFTLINRPRSSSLLSRFSKGIRPFISFLHHRCSIARRCPFPYESIDEKMEGSFFREINHAAEFFHLLARNIGQTLGRVSNGRGCVHSRRGGETRGGRKGEWRDRNKLYTGPARISV